MLWCSGDGIKVALCFGEGILLRGGNLLWGQKLLWDGSCSGEKVALGNEMRNEMR
ncbi:MAG: hypothetical protein KBC30_11450 [Planctomycetes bacterium]|nr:hypothetical protein [Planctomycetota bacterium]